MVVYLFLVAILGFLLYSAYNYIRTLGFNHNSTIALMISAPLILLIFLFRGKKIYWAIRSLSQDKYHKIKYKKQNRQGFFWLFIIGLSLLIILFFQYSPSISSNISNSIENSKIDNILQDFSSTDWEAQGDNSPIVRNFCSDVCSPASLTSYGIGGYGKVISCNCGNIDMFKGTAEGVRNYYFDYEGNVLKEVSEKEYKQRLEDYHKNNP
jgi:hypothetical protein